jgi:hypothetical protein
MRRAGILVVACAIAACDAGSPAGPTPIPDPSGPPPPAAAQYSLSGTVSSGSSALPSSVVEIVEGPSAGRSASADDKGLYKFEALPPGQLTVKASAPGYEPRTADVVLDADRTADFVLPEADPPPGGPDNPPAAIRASLSGVVSAKRADGTTTPIASAVVAITTGVNQGRQGTTDSSGRYRLDDLAPERLTIEAAATGYASRQLRVTLDDERETADFVLDPLAPAIATQATIVHVLTGAGVAGIQAAGDGISGGPSAANGAMVIGAQSATSTPRSVLFTGSGIVDRRTAVPVPGVDVVVSVIPRDFDLDAFEEMFRDPLLRRWMSAPPLVVQRRAVVFTDAMMADAVAEEDAMTEAEADGLVSDLQWALPQLTGGTYQAFDRVTQQTAEPGTRVTLLNTGVITIARVSGLRAATGFTGFARWQQEPGGRVTAGLIMLDRDVDREGGPHRRGMRAHELGHALGYGHVTARASVMNASALLEPNAFDRDASRVAFSRPPGNRAPDADPDPAQTLQRAGAPAWSDPVR